MYDKKKEVNKFLMAQYELRFNRDKPKVNHTSHKMLHGDGWKPLYKRTDEIVNKKNSAIGKPPVVNQFSY